MKNVQKFFKMKRNIISDKKMNRCFSFSPKSKRVSIDRLNSKESLSNKSLLKNFPKSKVLQINYNGVETKIPKIKFYKMKNIDLSQLKAYKKEIEELIRQKKIYMERENNICNEETLDLIANLKEKEYRDIIIKLQKRIINKKVKKKEIYDHYKIILNIVKDIENKISSDFQYYRNMTENRINSNINEINLYYEKKFAKTTEFSDYLVFKFNEIISKMEIIIKSYKLLNKQIINFNEENSHLKKKLKQINEINNKLCFDYKIKERNKFITESSFEKKSQKLIFYKKLKNISSKKFNDRKSKKTNLFNNNTFLNNDINNGQTYYTSNNINLLTNKTTNKNNLILFSSNCLSTSNISNINKEKSKEKKELNYIDKLKNKIKILKYKINQMKNKENKTKNPFYDLIIKIFQDLSKEEDINTKYKNNNKKIISSQNYKFRNKFINKLLTDVRLYKILNSKNLEGINYFKINLFNQDKNNK